MMILPLIISYMVNRDLLVLIFIALGFCADAQDRYTELYRPQYHVSPRSSFMGDPNGPIKFDGQYHLFWWGHLVSEDLVYWTEINGNALHGTPSGFGNWSGSVVVDIDNTAGFGTAEDTAMIAVYTLHEDATGYQHQAISYSLNHGSFEYYEGNPVIESSEPDFRDPQVFWYEPDQKWVMVITKPVDRAIRIYSSKDLKVWTLESTFSDRGAKKEVWEVPDLFQLPVNGNADNKKWVMTCGMGPNRMQFWVGEFDGNTFTLAPDDNLLTGKQVPGEVFADFENDYANWSTEGTAFGSSPAFGTLENQQEVRGYTGYQLVNSFQGGDATTGKLVSPSFEITKRHINFQIGGGSGSEVGLRVVVDGEAVETIASTSNTETLQWRGIDVSDHIGKTAHIEIFDDATGGWGHVLVDHIVFSDYQYDTRVENANWADWGLDFYAAKSFRNYDNDDPRKIWLAWMGNWTYARDVPTRPWKGCQSLPRELSLVNDEYGYQLVQKPINELQKLRKNEFSKNNFSVEGKQSLEAFTPEWNVYELKVSFEVESPDQHFGLSLAEGENTELIIGYDASTSTVYMDRSETTFSFAYKRITEAPVLVPEDSILDLHVFLDQSSVEIFTNDYKTSITSLVFSDVTTTGISLFSENGPVTVNSLVAWDLESIWGITPDQVELPEEPKEPLGFLENEKMIVYPNPVRRGEYLTCTNANTGDLKLYDLTGQLIHESYNALQIPEDLLPGIYMLSIQSAQDQSETIKKIIVK